MSHGFNWIYESAWKILHAQHQPNLSTLLVSLFPWNKVVYYKININDFQYLKKKKDQDSFWNIINDFKYIQKLLFVSFILFRFF